MEWHRATPNLEINKDTLLKKLIYLYWCEDNERSPSLCETFKAFNDWMKTTKFHCGDCTLIPCSCSRCYLNYLEIQAENALIILCTSNEGNCGNNCIEECDYKKTEGG